MAPTERDDLVDGWRWHQLHLADSVLAGGCRERTNKASTTMRNIPDVSVNADPTTGYDIYVSGGWGTWGGTSAAAPVWAGFVALVNQQRASSGTGPIGFANPILYGIGQGSGYGSDFHDINDRQHERILPGRDWIRRCDGLGFDERAKPVRIPKRGSVPTSGC